MPAEALEDERGIDRAALRERLALTPAGRVARMVEEVRIWSEILDVADPADR